MLFWYEIKKLLSGVALWIFVVLCIAFNIWAIPWGLREGLDTITPFSTNVFENHNTNEIAESYRTFFELSGRVTERMNAKYENLQVVVDDRAMTGDSFSAYFGEHTYIMHTNLFHGFGITGRLLLQGILLAVLLSLLSIGHEQINNTAHGVYATKTGRRLLLHKIAASLTAGIGLYLLLAIITFTVYFSVFDFNNVWYSSVSSGFNYIDDLMGVRPFITWHSFTVASYFWATLGVSIGLIVCFILMGITVGTLLRNSYISFLIVMVFNAVCIIIPLVISRNFYVHYIAMHTPIFLWLNKRLWFTDGGFITLWRNFELWGMGISLFVLTTFCVLAVKKFEKRDIA